MSNAITLDQARKILEDNRISKLEECRSKIDALLKEYGFCLTVSISITPDGRIVGSPVITPPVANM
jgi:hypothetical protein